MTLTIKSATSPRWANEDHTAIDLTVELYGIDGAIPFTAAASDPEKHGRTLYAAAVAGDYGAIAAYIAPPVVIPTTVSMRQGRLALLAADKLSAVDAAINAMPSPQKEAARIEWDYASELRRDNPLLTALAGALNLDDAALDQLFLQASTL